MIVSVVLVSGFLGALPVPDAGVDLDDGPRAVFEEARELKHHDLRVHVLGNPILAGDPVGVLVELRATSSVGLEDASVDAVLHGPGDQTLPVELSADEPSRGADAIRGWTAEPVRFPEPGAWTLTLELELPRETTPRGHHRAGPSGALVDLLADPSADLDHGGEPKQVLWKNISMGGGPLCTRGRDVGTHSITPYGGRWRLRGSRPAAPRGGGVLDVKAVGIWALALMTGLLLVVAPAGATEPHTCSDDGDDGYDCVGYYMGCVYKWSDDDSDDDPQDDNAKIHQRICTLSEAL